jgi:hypothetical protein
VALEVSPQYSRQGVLAGEAFPTKINNKQYGDSFVVTLGDPTKPITRFRCLRIALVKSIHSFVRSLIIESV